jgi:hypothetical protein
VGQSVLDPASSIWAIRPQLVVGVLALTQPVRNGLLHVTQDHGGLRPEFLKLGLHRPEVPGHGLQLADAIDQRVEFGQ